MIVLALVCGVVYQFRNNFHPVIPDRVFRSAQLNPETLEHMIEQHNIKTVINLRGSNPGKKWYQAELALINKRGIKHYDVNFTSSLLPRVDQLNKFIDLLETAQKPVLFHCKLGADRSGLASSVALLLDSETALSKIWEQLSWQYFIVKQDSTGKQFLNMYQQWLHDKNQQHHKAVFLAWVKKEYQDSNNNIYYYINPINKQVWERPDGQYSSGYKFYVDRATTDKLVLTGWGIDLLKQSVLKGVDVYFDKVLIKNTRYGIYHHKMLEDFANPAYLYSAWEAVQDLRQINDGCYDLVLRFVRMDGSHWMPKPQGRICIQ